MMKFIRAVKISGLVIRARSKLWVFVAWGLLYSVIMELKYSSMPHTHYAPFPATAWTRVLAAQNVDEGGTLALEEVCRAYWRPAYSFLRALGCQREDALDLTQDFLSKFSQAVSGIAAVDPQKGKLRSYMKEMLRHHFYNHVRDSSRQKRGGGQKILPLHELEGWEEPAEGTSADHHYDQAWAFTLLERAMKLLRESYEKRGKLALFDLIKEGLLLTGELPQRAQIMATAGVTDAQLRVELHRARKRLVEALQREVTEVAGPDGVDEELRYLLNVLTA
jgi:RNA polymerase sigma factor (sigma-70 family)